jgi:hypothetical protein
MGSSYRQSWDEDGNVIDPAFFVEDMNALAGEFNGNTDRDNYAAADIAAGEVAYQTFNHVPQVATDTPFSPDMATTDWQTIDTLTWTATQDAHYDGHWSGEWFWNGSASYTNVVDTTARTNPSLNYTDIDTIELRVCIDGTPISVAGPFDDNAQYLAAAMVGAAQLPAGVHIATLEARMFRRTWQTGASAQMTAAVCTNAVTIGSRTLMFLERDR